MKTTLFSVVLVSLGWNAAAADRAAPGGGDLGRLQGRWAATAGPRRQYRVLLEVKGRGVSVAISTPQGLDFQAEGRLKLDETTTPRSLDWYDFVGPGEQPLPEIAAVYKVEGDTLTVCNGGPHGARPREFKPGDGPLADLVVFHRLPADPPDSQARPPAGPPPTPGRDPSGAGRVRPAVDGRAADGR